MYGRTYMGMERTTFVIGPDGVIKEIFRKVKPAEHDQKVLGALAAESLFQKVFRNGWCVRGGRIPRRVHVRIQAGQAF